MNYELLMEIAAGVLLGPCAVLDIRTKRIPLYPVLAVLAAASALELFLIWKGALSVTDLLLALMPGTFLLLVAGITGGRMGAGDGVVFLAIGLLTGFRNAVWILFIALLLSAVWGGSLLLRKKTGRNHIIPWMPSVMAAYVLWISLKYLPA